MSKPILTVFGATGAQGGGLARAGAEIVVADLDDVCSVQRALEGAYGTFLLTNFR